MYIGLEVSKNKTGALVLDIGRERLAYLYGGRIGSGGRYGTK